MSERIMLLTMILTTALTMPCTWSAAQAPAQPVLSGSGLREFPFVGGSVMVPSVPEVNSRGVITDQTVPGQTHIEAYLFWRMLEPARDEWDFSSFDEMLALAREHYLKMLVFPWLMYAPQWFLETEDYEPIVDMETGQSPDVLSPWAPGTLTAYDHFYKALAERYRDAIDIILVAYPSSDYGEVGMIMGAPFATQASGIGAWFPQDPETWHAGFWCGDRHARADFRERMVKHHGSLEAVNEAWGTNSPGIESIQLPEPGTRMEKRRYWLDFMHWYNDSQTRTTRNILGIVRKHFPSKYLEVALGYGSDHPHYGFERSALCAAMADYAPGGIRSTHGSFNRDVPPRAYWFYKRMAPVCHRFGVGFGTEPPGGDLTYDELRRQYFEDASAGINLFYTYFQNYNLRPGVVEEFKAILRPSERALVDIGVLYPTTQMLLDVVHFPEGQIQFCNEAREFLDYDVVDENMVAWGMLEDYRVLVATSGHVFEQATLDGIRAWVEGGGVLICHGTPDWETVDGEHPFATLFTGGGDPARLGKGRIVTVDAPDVPGFVAGTLETLSSLNREGPMLRGFDGCTDGKLTTEFPDGRLVLDTRTWQTSFTPMPGHE